MDVVVVLSHPRPASLAHAVAQRAVDTLERNGHTVHLLDLYALEFEPVMSPEDRTAYHSPVPQLDPLAIEHAALLQATDAIVFVYPTWWSALPAMLKGWLEKVMVPGVGFRFDEHGKVRPGLTNVRHLIGISTYGSPRRYVRAINDNGRRTITRALRMSCGRRTRTSWLGLYAIDTSTAEQRAAFLDRVGRVVSRLGRA